MNTNVRNQLEAILRALFEETLDRPEFRENYNKRLEKALKLRVPPERRKQEAEDAHQGAIARLFEQIVAEPLALASNSSLPDSFWKAYYNATLSALDKSYPRKQHKKKPCKPWQWDAEKAKLKPDQTPSPVKQLMDEEQKQLQQTRVLDAISHLPQAWQVIAHKKLDGVSGKEIGAELGVTDARISQIWKKEILPLLKEKGEDYFFGD
jgi:DNA-directed RNA polymerase specialized sigma24 family protein